jgi:hypothetical protein
MEDTVQESSLSKLTSRIALAHCINSNQEQNDN